MAFTELGLKNRPELAERLLNCGPTERIRVLRYREREIIDDVNAVDLARFARRDWSVLAELKAEYWASMKAREGAANGLTVADELRRYAQRMHPDWPSEEDRREDLETHIRVSATLRSVHAARRS